ncbi:ABC transporter permease [Aeromicrobium sp. CF4.19]|uniref:ABC transporter permease n=1 Tax=Aeromicrobium sp. CF4.19 TaxID=3373082 RepID=UPI003EE54FEC
MPEQRTAVVRRERSLPGFLQLGNAGVVYAFLVIVAVLSVATAMTGRPSYVSPDNISNVLDQAALLGIIAVTTTIVLISGNFDLSVGSVAALGAATCLVLMPTFGFWGAFVVALLVGAAVGLFNGLVVQFIGINAFIVTLGTMTAVRGVVLILTDGRTITAEEGAARDGLRALDSSRWVTPNLYLIIGLALLLWAAWRWWSARRADQPTNRADVLVPAVVGVLLVVVSPVMVLTLQLSQRATYLLLLVAGAALVLRFTTIGRRLYATGGNPEAARLSGIAVDRYRVVAFVLNGTAAAFVGVLYASRLTSINPTALNGFELTALAAAILGGTSLFGGLGSVTKSIIGALILTTLANGFNILNLGANYQGLIQGVVLIVAAGMYTVAIRRRQRTKLRTVDASTSGSTTPPETEREADLVVSASDTKR